MSDYTKAYDGAAKDAANSTVLGADFDTEFDAIETAIATKSNKIGSPTAGNLISQDANGDLVDSGRDKDSPTFTGVTATTAEADELTIVEKADHTSTPAAGKGYVWVRNDAPNVLVFTDDAGTDFVLSREPQVSGHIRAGNTQIIDGDPAAGLAHFDVDGNITENTFESIGPTGSGATNIWTDLDQVPASATILLCDLRMAINSDSASFNPGMSVYVAHGDIGSPSLDTEDSRIALLTADNDAIGQGNGASFRVMIPLGPTNKDFQLAWSSSDDSLEFCWLYYRGFMTD